MTVLIPSWNGAALLEKYLPSILAACQGYHDARGSTVEVLIVDDGSSDNTREWLSSRGFKSVDVANNAGSGGDGLCLRFIASPRNLGFSKSCNIGMRVAAHDLVLLLNNDVRVEADAIPRLTERLQQPGVFAAHCRVFDAQRMQLIGTGKLARFSRGFIRVHDSYDVSQRDWDSNAPNISAFAGGGASMFDRRKLVDIGGFQELLSPFYWEDVELSYRAWKRGWIVVYEPGAVARHSVSSTIGKLNRTRVLIIQQRNRLLLHWINLHDGRFMASHLTWVALLALTAPLRLQPWFLVSVGAALLKLPAVLSARRRERTAAKVSDRELIDLFKGFKARLEQRGE